MNVLTGATTATDMPPVKTHPAVLPVPVTQATSATVSTVLLMTMNVQMGATTAAPMPPVPTHPAVLPVPVTKDTLVMVSYVLTLVKNVQMGATPAARMPSVLLTHLVVLPALAKQATATTVVAVQIMTNVQITVTTAVPTPLVPTQTAVLPVVVFQATVAMVLNVLAHTVPCPSLTAPAHGAMSSPGPHYDQDVVTFTCNQGYELDGVTSVTCEADSKTKVAWSDPVPTCIEYSIWVEQSVFIPCNQTRDLGPAQRQQLQDNFQEKLLTILGITAENVVVTDSGINFELQATEVDSFLTFYTNQLAHNTFTVGDDVNPDLFYLRDATDFTE
ncbi:uncharacterized protein LOC144914449 [Branchiostoma floridae x Branchiostoma belcheri]